MSRPHEFSPGWLWSGSLLLALACRFQAPEITVGAGQLMDAGMTPVPTPTAAPVNERVGVFIEETNYTVQGADAPELLEAMRSHPDAPASDLTRGDFFSATVWEIQIAEGSLLAEDGTCTPGGMVTVHVETIYPDWKAVPEAGAQLAVRWEQFISALKEHEGGHLQIATNGGYALQNEVDRLAAETTCAEFASALAASHRRIVEQTSDAHARYDEQTGHGLTQGAVWS